MLIPKSFLFEIIKIAWSKQTSTRPTKWSQDTPYMGQSASTTLVIQEFLGGTILKSKVSGNDHYWNKLPDGQIVDLTEDQYSDEEYLSASSSSSCNRDVLLDNNAIRRKYTLLLGSIFQLLVDVNTPM